MKHVLAVTSWYRILDFEIRNIHSENNEQFEDWRRQPSKAPTKRIAVDQTFFVLTISDLNNKLAHNAKWEQRNEELESNHVTSVLKQMD